MHHRFVAFSGYSWRPVPTAGVNASNYFGAKHDKGEPDVAVSAS